MEMNVSFMTSVRLESLRSGFATSEWMSTFEINYRVAEIIYENLYCFCGILAADKIWMFHL